MQTESLSEQAPSSLQREERLQAAADTAAHFPSFTPHLPSLEHAADDLQSASTATHCPSLELQRACCLHAADFAQSSFDLATHRPFSAAQVPSLAHALSVSGLGSFVPAQCNRESATH